MPLFKVQWDGMGFTSRKSMTEREINEGQAARYTKQLQKAGELPEGVRGVFAASVSPDGKEGGEWKVFVGVGLIVEANDMQDVEMSDPPEEFLLKVASKMIRGDADASYGLSGTFEILDVEPFAEPSKAVSSSRMGRLQQIIACSPAV